MILWNLPWESGWAPASKSHNTVGTSLCPGHPGFLHSQVILTEPPATHQLELRFSSHGTGSSGGLRSGTLLQLICYSPYPMVVSLTSGQQLALCSPLSHGSKRSWWFLNLFSFYLLWWSCKSQVPHAWNQKNLCLSTSQTCLMVSNII